MQRSAQISVLDAGGQYCHLIARRVRDLGVYADVFPSNIPASRLSGSKGVIISGGPSSVYDPSSPAIDPSLLSAGLPVLGICYGQQLIAQSMGGSVTRGEKGEYGFATLDRIGESVLLEDIADRQRIWMSHRDAIAAAPPGFSVTARTETCAVAAMEDAERQLYGVQFHPEVVHTAQGLELLAKFVFGICGCSPDWDPHSRVSLIEEQIRETAGQRNVFFFVSGGVDSTVAFTLCLRALGKDRVRGVYVDTGLMREGESEFVARTFDGAVSIEDAHDEFLRPLAEARDPELKRSIIGEQFVKVQERIVDTRHLLDGNWILGQGTIYPDTIESGGTQQAAVIKTHHNRVAGIQRLIESKRIVEPLSSYYKDEVRAIGRELDLPGELLDRHPFPGPGLAIRCLCAEADAPLTCVSAGYIVPVQSVGVQGDSRTYAPVLALDKFPSASARLQEEATGLVNHLAGINRVIAHVDSHVPLAAMRVHASALTPMRIERLRRSDSLIREISASSGFDRQVWQFPVILIPLGAGEAPDSVVLRPIHSQDGMTAESVVMEDSLLRRMAAALLEVEGVCGVFYDLTHKPPATIEWE